MRAHARLEVAVTGLGLVIPAGTDPGSAWETMTRGRCLASPDPELSGLPVAFSCRVDGIDPVQELGLRLARRLDRFIHLALIAARQAMADACLEPTARLSHRVGVVLGVGSNSLATYLTEFNRLDAHRPHRVSPLALTRSVPSMAASEVAMDLGIHGTNFTIASACASGATALGVARDLIRAGACDVVLAGGSESARSPMTAACFHQLRALSQRCTEPHLAARPFDRERDGFVLGEGAAVLVLERRDHARRRGARLRAVLRGFGSSADAYHPTAPHPQGLGAEQAIHTALTDAGCRTQDIGHINAHATSTPLGDATEADLYLRLYRGTPPPVTAPKSIIGHALGAAGAIEAALTVLSLEHQQVLPTANLFRQDPGRELDIVRGRPRDIPMQAALTTSFGFGGQNAALVFTLP
ncbi:beta-ketoacyl-[acyl-carrier-protein] synthase family protein [Streptomyces sp. NPDC098789]|uniref:beta-ketoacyl-[acyl-carrier-protein] synthase family protein n=1 Tax=Streptomyces sp. NPDC098789 TaxID=3366098 RepID=UPI0037F2E2A6